jgi:GH25 family lysozyme M1 (1,4-beta-N-acetylmuramidase)
MRSHPPPSSPVSALVVLAAVALATGCEHDLSVADNDRGDVAAAGAWDIDATDEQALTRSCRPSTTLKGIDVSYYQEQVDWSAVRRGGVAFAFIRVSDGLTFVDPRFEQNWREARAAGVRRGAYQFFRSNKDPIAQADLLLEMMGPLQDGDLPPVIDVESTDGQPRSVVAARVSQWIEHVERALGVRPIVYTGPYFWRDNVAADALGDHPLWIAHYGTDCPLVPAPWSRFTFHQFTDAGRVAGVSGNVDVNVFAGTMADLDALGFKSGAPSVVRPPAADCAAVPPTGGVLEDDDACTSLNGPGQYWRAAVGEGHDGSLAWTHATSATERDNYASWNLLLERPGTYSLAVWTDSSIATSQRAKYRVEHDGVIDTAIVDQRAVEGWRTLGTYHFRSGRARVVLNDNTGESTQDRRVLVVDALKVSPSTATTPGATCTRVRVINAETLNIRPTASTARAAVGSLRAGEIVERIRSVDGQSIHGNRTWHEVRDGGTRGYIAAYYASCVN